MTEQQDNSISGWLFNATERRWVMLLALGMLATVIIISLLLQCGVVSESSGIKFVKIPSGSFLMGSISDGKYIQANEPQHEVVLTNDFYMAKTETTIGQWNRVMGVDVKGDSNLPITGRTWDEINTFIRRLSVSDGRVYRLPTEAEWEYACRTGSKTLFYFGDKKKAKQVFDEYAWYSENSGDKLHAVGQKLPNAWGLYDCAGNAWELCSDWYGEDYYLTSPKEDPTGSKTGTEKVVRGGSADNLHAHVTFEPMFCRSAARMCISLTEINERDLFLGFRIVMESSTK